METNKFIGTKTRLQIAEEYQISYPTFWRMIKSNHLELPGGLLSPKWQKIIYDTFGYPPGVYPVDYAPNLESNAE
ncbi:MAG: hypothetical protein GC192_19940 [Bacteroidetes bacterium]|nr:hypothetical protein [Bacteroidota bacterium]